MAYVPKELKNTLVDSIKPIAKKYNLRVTFRVDNLSTFIVTVRESKGELMFADLIGNHKEFHSNTYKKNTQEHDFLNEVFAVIQSHNYNNSDLMTDYFDVGFYYHITIGEYNKPYIGKK